MAELTNSRSINLTYEQTQQILTAIHGGLPSIARLVIGAGEDGHGVYAGWATDPDVPAIYLGPECAGFNSDGSYRSASRPAPAIPAIPAMAESPMSPYASKDDLIAAQAKRIEELEATIRAPIKTAEGAQPVVLDSEWRTRLLDGRPLERDKHGFADHPELPVLDEGMKPKQFFAALGVELRHVEAEDQIDWDLLDSMSEAGNWNGWTPKPPAGSCWNLVAIYDSEDGLAAWWMRELQDTPAAPAAVGDGREALNRLEAACDMRAKLTTPEAYKSIAACEGMIEALEDLDEARRQARAALAAPQTQHIDLPEPDFKLRWNAYGARYTVSKPDIGDTDCYSAETVRSLLKLAAPQEVQPDELITACRSMAAAGNRVSALNRYRNETGCSLVEARDAIFPAEAQLAAPVVQPDPLVWMHEDTMAAFRRNTKSHARFPVYALAQWDSKKGYVPLRTSPQAQPEDADGKAFRTAAQLGLTLRFYGGCAQSSIPGTPSAYEVVTSNDRAAGMREAVQKAQAAIAAQAKGE